MDSPAFYLYCEKGTHPPVPLPDLVPIFVGRNREMQIQDVSCSREQVQLIAVEDTEEVVVKVFGNKPSRVDGITLRKEECYIARDGSLLEITAGDHLNRIKFKKKQLLYPPADNNKRQLEESLNVPIEKKKKLNVPMWEEVDNSALLIFSSGFRKDSEKIAAFDLDGTIIKTKSGKIFPVDTSDWVVPSNVIKEKLNNLIKENYNVIIFSNQNGIGRQAVNKGHFKIKIENIVKELNIPVEVYLSTRSSIYRKPAPGMWNALLHKKGGNISLKESFYVGDAAGRCEKWAPGRRKDFSNSDRLFAENIGLQFFTPEEYFFGNPPAPFDLPKFIPSAIPLNKHGDYNINTSRKEVIIMVGAQGSGKSHFVKQHLMKSGYIPFSRDISKNNDKVAACLETSLSLSECKIVIDNTNGTIAARKKFIDLCKKYKVPVRCFYMNTTIERCHHNNKFREFTDTFHQPISPMVINSFRKHFIEPSKEEGFEDIVSVPFVPEFKNSYDEKLYKMYLY